MQRRAILRAHDTEVPRGLPRRRSHRLQRERDMLLTAIEKLMKHNDIISIAVEAEYTEEESEQVDDALNDCGDALEFCCKANPVAIE